MGHYLFVFTLIYTLFLTQISWAYECDSEDLINTSALKQIATQRSATLLTGPAQVQFYSNYGSLMMCPAQNYNNTNLSSAEKRNLLELLKNDRINGFENYIADNLNFLNLDSEIESYKRVHALAFGENTPLPSGVQLIIRNKELYKQDRKEQCTEKSVDTTHMGPVRNQGDIGWCYAYAAADLMSFHARRPLSAVDVAILNNNFAQDPFRDRLELPTFLSTTEALRGYYAKNNINADDVKQSYLNKLFDSRREGGQEDEALRIAMQRGVCSEADMPSRLTDDNSSLYAELQRPTETRNQNSFSCTSQEARSYSLLPNLNNGQIAEVVAKASPFYTLFALRQKNCRQTYKPQKKTISKASAPQYGRAFSLLDAQLDKNAPAMVSYNFNMISSEDGAHASIIVGRRLNSKTGQCEYKVRNSWGNYNHFEPSTRTRHEDGHFWVSETRLKKNLYDITVLD